MKDTKHSGLGAPPAPSGSKPKTPVRHDGKPNAGEAKRDRAPGTTKEDTAILMPAPKKSGG